MLGGYHPSVRKAGTGKLIESGLASASATLGTARKALREIPPQDLQM